MFVHVIDRNGYKKSDTADSSKAALDGGERCGQLLPGSTSRNTDIERCRGSLTEG
jgi:hypothetical protein